MREAMLIRDAHTEPALSYARQLFTEYAATLGAEVCFHQFERELALLPGDYVPPRGCLLLATEGGSAAGCVALHGWSEDSAEMKRLYVPPAFRGKGVARALVLEVLSRARAGGYVSVRLDTLPSMRAAQALYRALGFEEIPPYGDAPVPGALHLELRLQT